MRTASVKSQYPNRRGRCPEQGKSQSGHNLVTAGRAHSGRIPLDGIQPGSKGHTMTAQIDRQELNHLMARLAVDDAAALSEFVDQFGEHLAKSVGGILKSLHRRDVTRRLVDKDFLVWSAALILFDRADRWDPSGSLPWVWAHRAIRAEVVSWAGHPRVEFDPLLHVENNCDNPVPQTDIDLRELACHHEEIANWMTAVDEVANSRDRRVHVEYQTQKHLGDRSPANTVSAMFNLSPANIRQIDRRVRRRLAAHPFHASAIAPALIGQR